jgi:hypothetical protein
MSASILANRERYLALVRELLDKRISGEDFSRAFLAERMRDLEKDDQIRRRWTRRYDLELEEAYRAGRLSAEEFSARWHTLWAYPKDSPFIAFFEKLFSVIEAYEPDIEVFEMPRGEWDYYFHSEEELRHQVAELLAELEREESLRHRNHLT